MLIIAKVGPILMMLNLLLITFLKDNMVFEN